MDKYFGISEKLGEPIDKVLFTREEIQKRVEEMGARISADFQGRDLLVVCVLKGSIYFTADLIRKIQIPLSLDFICVSSYGDSTRTSGIARITKDLDEDIEGRSVLITEDILDSGLTLDYLTNLFRLRGPEDIRICTLLDKPDKRVAGVKADYVGFTIPDLFVVGYGLDYQHKYRHLPFICTFRDEYIPES